MILIFFVVFLPVIITTVLYFLIGKHPNRYHYLPGFYNTYLQIPEGELTEDFGKPMLRDMIKLATFGSLFLFLFLLFQNVFLFLIEIICFMFLAAYFQNRANERLGELCDRYQIAMKKRGKRSCF